MSAYAYISLLYYLCWLYTRTWWWLLCVQRRHWTWPEAQGAQIWPQGGRLDVVFTWAAGIITLHKSAQCCARSNYTPRWQLLFVTIVLYSQRGGSGSATISKPVLLLVGKTFVLWELKIIVRWQEVAKSSSPHHWNIFWFCWLFKQCG